MGTIKDFLEMLLSCNGSKVKDWDLAAYESALQKAAYFPKVVKALPAKDRSTLEKLLVKIKQSNPTEMKLDLAIHTLEYADQVTLRTLLQNPHLPLLLLQRVIQDYQALQNVEGQNDAFDSLLQDTVSMTQADGCLNILKQMNSTLLDALKDYPDLLQENGSEYAARIIKQDCVVLFDSGETVAKNIEKEQNRYLAKLKTFIAQDKTCLETIITMLLLNDNLDVPLAQQASNQRVLHLILADVPLELLWDVNERLLGELSRQYKNFSQVYVTHLKDQISKSEKCLASEYNHAAGWYERVQKDRGKLAAWKEALAKIAL